METEKTKKAILDYIDSLCAQGRLKVNEQQARAYSVEIAQLTQGYLNLTAAEKENNTQK